MDKSVHIFEENQLLLKLFDGYTFLIFINPKDFIMT